MQVKVCGLTNAGDAAFAASEGADLLGFVVHPASPRHCGDLVAASAAVRSLAVLVMVSDDAEAMMKLAEFAGVQRIQPHVTKEHRLDVVLRLKNAGYFVLLPWADSAGQEALPADLYLWEADPLKTGLDGGSGRHHGMLFPPPGPFLLAGGLASENVVERVSLMPKEGRRLLQGFDAASRLEKSPGIKDPEKVRAFIRTARSISSEAFHDRH